jgi:molybdopterin-synthase adenylyltransferase
MSPQTGLVEAGDWLTSNGFVPEGAEWRGPLSVTGRTLTVQVKFPANFPRQLPQVFVDRAQLPRRVAHVEKNGKICIAPSSGFLLDMDNPAGIVGGSLQRAQKILDDGVTGVSDGDLIAEFLAYWADGAEPLISLCRDDPRSGRVAHVRMKPAGAAQIPSGRTSLVADSLSYAKSWLRKLNADIEFSGEAFLIRLEKAFQPPDFEQQVTTAEIRKLIRTNTTPESWNLLNAWLSRTTLPVTILFSMPAPDAGRILAGVRIEALEGAAQRKADKLIRPGKRTAAMQLNFAGFAGVKKLVPERYDPAFLIRRGGGIEELLTKTITVAGCGAVGSHVVQLLAAAGVGTFNLIDPEHLVNGNCHRHVLGVKHVGKNKAEAIAAEFASLYPHQTYVAYSAGFEDVWETKAEIVQGSDLLIMATGDETLGLKVNRSVEIGSQMHVWLDPLGLGGHVLSSGSHRGCYECLFSQEGGLHNAASFAAPNQNFQLSFAGCAGLFTPFGAVDAIRVAGIAAREAIRILLEHGEPSMLISWLGDRDGFRSKGFSLSKRADLLKGGEEAAEVRFARPGCRVCGGRE